ncbi:MAG: SBBP repeat-containing protein [Polyangiaceae bacterium]
MRRSVFLLTASLSLPALLAGCGSDTDTSGTGGTTSSTGGGGTGGSGGSTTTPSGGTGGSGLCTPGETMDCYDGPDGTLGVGLCAAGKQTCKANGEGFGPCEGQVTPATETCLTMGDDDCDGLVNEDGEGCQCKPGDMQTCYSGPMGTVDVGICHGGMQSCKVDGTGFGPCEGEVTPATETCMTVDDDDCDGLINEEGAGCVCVPGAMMPCYEGPAGTEGVGVCLGGNSVCNFTGTAWGACEGEVLPSVETCLTVDDDDCDGLINEEGAGCLCVPGTMVPCYTGPAGTEGVGICKGGTALCNALGTGIGACDGQVLPGVETCQTPVDDDCDGLVNEEGVGCSCTPGATQACYSGPAGTEGVGVCKGGVQTCANDGSGFGACAGEIVPTPENCSTAANEDCVVGADCGGAQWQKRFGATGDQQANAVARDPLNNVLVTGRFGGSFSIGGSVLMSAGGYDMFVAKLDPSGTPLWAKRFGDAAIYQEGLDITSDAQGDVIVAGYFEGTMNVGGVVLTSSGATDAFVMKLDPNGDTLWAKRFGAGGAQLAQAVAVDGQGNIAILADGFQTIDFGGGVLTSAGNYDMFVAKFDPSGAPLWSKRFGGANADFAQSLAFDGAGNILFTGKTDTALDFGSGTPLPAAGGQDAVLVKLDPLGSYIWDKRFGDGANQFGVRVASDLQNEVLLAGGFESSINLGGGPLTAVGAVDMFVAKLNSQGSHLWSKRYGAAGTNPSILGMTASPAGDMFFVGQVDGAIDFGGGNLPAGGGTDAFLVRLDPAGALAWGRRIGAGGNQYASSAAVDGTGAVLVSGYFDSAIDPGLGSMSSAGGLDIWVAKLAP